jgi:hypothetical protein
MQIKNQTKKVIDINYDALIKIIETDGFVVVKGVFTRDEIETYRIECEKQFKTAPRIEGKNYIEGITPNYTQPWSIDFKNRKIASYRLYEFYHNPMSVNTRYIVDTVIGIRSRIEAHWPEIQAFNTKNDFHDYNIIAKYEPESGYQSVHSDMDPTISHPALQAQIMLTQYEEDYHGGSLALHLKNGKTFELHKDFDLSVGDLVLFDKRIPHEVGKVLPGKGRNMGRWMALIGASTFPRHDSSLFKDLKIKTRRFMFLNTPVAVYNFLKKISRSSKKENFSKSPSSQFLDQGDSDRKYFQQ